MNNTVIPNIKHEFVRGGGGVLTKPKYMILLKEVRVQYMGNIILLKYVYLS